MTKGRRIAPPLRTEFERTGLFAKLKNTPPRRVLFAFSGLPGCGYRLR